MARYVGGSIATAATATVYATAIANHKAAGAPAAGRPDRRSRWR